METKKYGHLTSDDRVWIEALIWEGRSLRYIGKKVGKDPWTISREIQRNKTRGGVYKAEKAKQKVYHRLHYKKKQAMKLRMHTHLEWVVRWCLIKGLSPEKTALRIKREYHIMLSWSTVRRYIHSKYSHDLKQRLRDRKLLKRYKKKTQRKTSRIPYRVSIDARPLFVSCPMVTGHYECDFIESKTGDKTVFLTLIDKYSRQKIAVKLPHKEAWLVERVLHQLIKQYSIKTITFDNDLSFARHYKLGIKTYFCHPYSSREKGQIEKANAWRRKFFPKWTILKNIPQEILDQATSHLNHLPMECFAGRTPYEVHFNTSLLYLPIIFH